MNHAHRLSSAIQLCGGARAQFGQGTYLSASCASFLCSLLSVRSTYTLLQHYSSLTHTPAVSLASIIISVTSPYVPDQGLYFENKPGLVGIFVSLSTNLIATSLIAFKAWYDPMYLLR